MKLCRSGICPKHPVLGLGVTDDLKVIQEDLKNTIYGRKEFSKITNFRSIANVLLLW